MALMVSLSDTLSTLQYSISQNNVKNGFVAFSIQPFYILSYAFCYSFTQAFFHAFSSSCTGLGIFCCLLPSHSAASDLGLHCLPITLLRVFRIQWVKTPRKPASENVVCLCRLLNILANCSNLFLHTGKLCGPRSDCS